MSLASESARGKRQIVERSAQAERELREAWRHTLARINPDIARFLTKMASAPGINLTYLLDRGRLAKLQATVGQGMQGFAAHAAVIVGQSQRDAANLGDAITQIQLAATVPDNVAWNFLPARHAALSQIEHALTSDSRVARLLQSLDPQAQARLRRLLTQAILDGQGPRQTAAAIQQALDMSLSRALTIARTETLVAYRGAQLANFRANSDVVSGWIWMATAGACPDCADEDGTEHALGDDMETHPNCRCTCVPQTRSWSDILGAAGIGGDDM